MNLYRLQNEYIAISVSAAGAELKSLVSNPAGREWMWQGSPEFWPRTSPVLFPVVGKLQDNAFYWKGRQFPLSQHGFARDMEFEVIHSGKDSLQFRLKANGQSRRHYPFEFSLIIQYRLEVQSLIITYRVENEGQDLMPFSIGAHPGFALPSWPSRKCWLEFEKEENLVALTLKDGLISGETGREISLHNRLLENTAELFLKDALVFSGLRSNWIGIRQQDNPEQLRLHFSGFPFMGIWSKPGAPFVCIEPWFGHADPAGFSGELSEKPGICLLRPGAVFETSFRIEIISEK
jgi:galactose mutarotase-like enzyme